MAHVNVGSSFGLVAVDIGMATAIEPAKIYGIGTASIKSSDRFGTRAWVVQKALDADIMSLVLINSSHVLPD